MDFFTHFVYSHQSLKTKFMFIYSVTATFTKFNQRFPIALMNFEIINYRVIGSDTTINEIEFSDMAIGGCGFKLVSWKIGWSS